VLFLLALVGLNQPASAAGVGAVKTSKPQIPQKTPADAQIERGIMTKLAKSKLSADHFTVSVTKGVATIEGSTNVMQHKGVMTRMAKSCGAVTVRNNIRISDAAKAKAVANLSKATLSKNKATTATPHASLRSSPGAAPPALAAIPRATILPAAR
jgi:BON domain